MVYYLIIALQIACAYHVYKVKNSYYWYFLILLFPAIGCGIYISIQLLTKHKVIAVAEEFTNVIAPSKKNDQLEQKLAFSDTFQNRINLADAYLKADNLPKAEVAYTEALQGSHKDDFYANSQYIITLYNQEKYKDVISIAQKIESKADFNNSKSEFLYGLSLFALGEIERAEELLSKINQRYSNYEERLRLCKFYITHHKKDKALEVLDELQSEYENLLKPNRKRYQKIFTEVDTLKKSLS